MAIASVVVYSPPGRAQELAKALRSLAGVADCEIVAPDRLAAIIEAPAAKLLDSLRAVEKLPDFVNLELVYVNYEDDLEAAGGIGCPPLAEIYKRARDE